MTTCALERLRRKYENETDVVQKAVYRALGMGSNIIWRMIKSKLADHRSEKGVWLITYKSVEHLNNAVNGGKGSIDYVFMQMDEFMRNFMWKKLHSIQYDKYFVVMVSVSIGNNKSMSCIESFPYDEKNMFGFKRDKREMIETCSNPACDVVKNLKLCRGCKKIRYCSDECQRAHWSEHKKTCKLIA